MENDDGFVSPVGKGRRTARRVDASPRKGTNELSPRKVPRSPLKPPATPPNWKRPQDVMRLHRLKRSSLTSRFGSDEVSISGSSPTTNQSQKQRSSTAKRKNPFSVGKTEDSNVESPTKRCRAEGSVLRMLGLEEPDTADGQLNLQSIVDQIKQQSQSQEDRGLGCRVLPFDWSLRTKLRFLSAKPFPWNQTLKTCEEASAVSGFVRCQSECPDTSPNALLHKHCLYWQYPWLPWLSLYPRHDTKQNLDKTLPSFASHPRVKETLYLDFTESFNSAFQLLRARHCPYFYVVYNSFSCLFRAAGVGGGSKISAIVSPTTHGFRQQLKDNDVEFSLLLRKHRMKKTDIELEEVKTKGGEEGQTEEGDNEEDLDTRRWLSNLGLPTNQLDKLSPSFSVDRNGREEEGDSEESTIWVEDGEVQSLFNLLINLRGYSASTGPCAGIPPTILAPVAFFGATLTSLRVRESMVQGEGAESYHSMEVSGPILPHTIHYLCLLLHSYLDHFTVTCATDMRTRPFSSATCARHKSEGMSVSGPAFSVENLSDCGIESSLLQILCSGNVAAFDNIKFLDNTFVLA